MDIDENQKFQALRQQLDALHYRQPLYKESAPLVEKLLQELLTTNEKFQSLKQKCNISSQQYASFSKNQLAEKRINEMQLQNQKLQEDNKLLSGQIQMIQNKLRHVFDENQILTSKVESKPALQIQQLKKLIQQKDKQISDLLVGQQSGNLTAGYNKDKNSQQGDIQNRKLQQTNLTQNQRPIPKYYSEKKKPPKNLNRSYQEEKFDQDSQKFQQEIEILRNEQLTTNTIKITQPSDKKGYEESLDILMIENKKLQVSNEQNIERIQQLNDSLTDKEKEIQDLTKRCNCLQKEVEINQKSIKRVSEQTFAKTEESVELRNKVDDLDRKLIKQKNEMELLKGELERELKWKSQIQKQYEDSRANFIRLQAEKDSIEQELVKLQVKTKADEQQMDKLKQENKLNNQLLNKSKNNEQSNESRIQELMVQLRSIQSSSLNIQGQHDQLQEQLKQKTNQIFDLKEQIDDLEQQNKQIKPLQLKVEELKDLVQKQIIEKADMESTIFTFQRQLHDVEELQQNSQTQISSLTLQLDKALLQRDELLYKLEQFEKDSIYFSEAIKHSQIFKQESENYKIQIKHSKEQEAKLQDHINKLQQTNAKLEDQMQQTSRQLLINKQSKEDLNESLQQCKQEIIQVQNREKKLQSKLVQIEEKYQRELTERQDYQQSNSTLNIQIKELEDVVASLNRQLENEKQQGLVYLNQIQQLKLLIENADETREMLQQKLNTTHIDMQSVNQENRKVSQKISILNEELAQKEKTINNLNNKMRNLQQENEKLNSEVQLKENQLFQGQEKIHQLKEQFEQMELRMEDMNQLQTQQKKQIQEREDQIKSLQKQVNSQHSSMKELQIQLENKNNKHQESKKVLQQLKKQKDVQSSYLEDLKRENDKIQRELQFKEHNIEVIQKNEDLEKSDLIRKISQLKEENLNLQNNLAQLQNEVKDLRFQLRKKSELCQSLEEQIESHLQEINNLKQEVGELQEQINFLNQEFDAAQKEKSMIMQNQQENKAMETRRQLSSVEYENKNLKQQLRTAETELGSLRQQLNHERNKYDDLEQVFKLERERVQSMKLTQLPLHKGYDIVSSDQVSEQSIFSSKEKYTDLNILKDFTHQEYQATNLEQEIKKLREENNIFREQIFKLENSIEDFEQHFDGDQQSIQADRIGF